MKILFSYGEFPMPKRNYNSDMFKPFDKAIGAYIKDRIGATPINEVLQRIRKEITNISSKNEEDNVFDISSAQMHRYYRGDTPIPLFLLIALAKSFNFPINPLLDNSKDYLKQTDDDSRKNRRLSFFKRCFEEGSYNFYYGPFVHEIDKTTDKTKSLVRATWKVDAQKDYKVTLVLPTPENPHFFKEDKEYIGFPEVNNLGDQIFVNLDDLTNSEPINMVLNFDYEFNQPLKFAVGVASSIRSIIVDGEEMKRVPVMFRFCLTQKRLSSGKSDESGDGETYISDYLNLRKSKEFINSNDKVFYLALRNVDRMLHRYLENNYGYIKP